MQFQSTPIKGRGPIVRACEVCGALFRAHPYRVNKGQSRWCSTICSGARLAGQSLRPDAFWANVDRRSPDECWEWMGSRDGNGYGMIPVRRNGRRHIVKAHRHAWVLANGAIPEGAEVCHNCPGADNPACVNPRHLYPGTHQQNMKDMAEKGRLAGGRVGGRRLTSDNVLEIRRRVAAGESRVALARAFNVKHSTIGAVVSRKTWAHIT
jgi:hypothetical protein